jgi:hypothetical protein
MSLRSESSPRYKGYLLRHNPFPESPTLDPTSDDPRTSGEIFNEKIFAEEIEGLWNRLRTKINVLYVTGGGWDRGIGKSALVFYCWKSLKKRSDVTAAYFRASAQLKPSDFCNQFVRRWHNDGYLWEAFKNFLQEYKSSPSPMIRPSKIDSFLQSYPHMPERVPLRVFTYEREAKVASDMQKWAQRRDSGIIPEAVRAFFATYLISPADFIEVWNSLKVKGHDDIDYFATLLRILSLTEKWSYLIIDQFEVAVQANQGKNQLGVFCSEMRRVVEACAGRGTLIVTLHPESEKVLEQIGGEHLTGLAGLDERHTLNIKDITMDEAVDIALSYLEYFRRPNTKPKNDLYPLEEETIKYVQYVKGGLPRHILHALFTIIEEGVNAQFAKLDTDFLKKNHQKIFDIVFEKVAEEKFRSFKKLVG